jgi:hypothetical protein
MVELCCQRWKRRAAGGLAAAAAAGFVLLSLAV